MKVPFVQAGSKGILHGQQFIFAPHDARITVLLGNIYLPRY